MRKLASICTVKETWSLEGKDRVIGCNFEENGYEAMVGKDTKVGDLVLFIQEGAILPVKEEWEFLRTRCFKENLNGFLIKPMKFSTIKSWGLVVNIGDVEELKGKKFKSGDDLTEVLHVRKYDEEETQSKSESLPAWVKFCRSHRLIKWIGDLWVERYCVSDAFPTDLISKSDETTIQNCKNVLEKFADSFIYITAKLEGQSFTVVPVFKGKKFAGAYVCSRSVAFRKKTDNTFWKMMEKYDVINKMKMLWEKQGKAYIIQGEQVGEGIQNNIYDFEGNHWYVFTVKDYFTREQLAVDEAKGVAENDFGMNFVPILSKELKLSDVMPTVEAAVAYAEDACWMPLENGKINWWLKSSVMPKGKKLWRDYLQHEGVVVRSMAYDKDKNIGFSMKVKNFQYSEKTLGKIHEICVASKKNTND